MEESSPGAEEVPAVAEQEPRREEDGSDSDDEGSGSSDEDSVSTTGSLTEHPLDVSDTKLSRDDLIKLSLHIYDDEVVTALDVSGNEFVALPANDNIIRAQARRLMPFVKEPKEYEHVDWEVIETFCKSLRANRTLRSLSMARTCLGLKGQRGLVLLGQALQERNRRVNFQHLDLSGVHLLGESQMRYNGLVALCNFIQNTSSLKTLILRDNWLHTEAIKFLASALYHNSSVTILDLQKGYSCSSAMQAFSPWFRQKCRLTHLNISQNYLGNEEARILGQDLAFMNTLQTLNLRDNHIKVTGCETIARMLPFNESLTSIDMSQNQFYSEGAALIFNELAKNRGLLTLRLEDNQLTHYSTETIERCLRSNHTLQHLHLDGNAIPPSDLKTFELHLSVNRDIVAIREDPVHYEMRAKGAAFKNELLLKLKVVGKAVHVLLRNQNASMKVDARFREALGVLAPYTRKEMLAMLESSKSRRNKVINRKLRALTGFLGGRLASMKRAEEERKRRKGDDDEEEEDDEDYTEYDEDEDEEQEGEKGEDAEGPKSKAGVVESGGGSGETFSQGPEVEALAKQSSPEDASGLSEAPSPPPPPPVEEQQSVDDAEGSAGQQETAGGSDLSPLSSESLQSLPPPAATMGRSRVRCSDR